MLQRRSPANTKQALSDTVKQSQRYHRTTTIGYGVVQQSFRVAQWFRSLKLINAYVTGAVAWRVRGDGVVYAGKYVITS